MELVIVGSVVLAAIIMIRVVIKKVFENRWLSQISGRIIKARK